MTVLKEYKRLEAIGLWRAARDAQRRDVVLSLGDSTLLIADIHDKVLAHWSLAAIIRENPGQMPALYYPDGNPNETLELDAEAADMIDALTRVRARIDKERSHPGRLRAVILAGCCIGLVVFGTISLPRMLRNHALTVVPQVTVQAIGDALFEQVQKTTGQPCSEETATAALETLSARLDPDHNLSLRVVTEGITDVLSLPGGIRLVHYSLLRDYDSPEVLAGHLLADDLRNSDASPMERLIDFAGTWPTLKLMSTGALPDQVITDFARHLMNTPKPVPDSKALADRFARAKVAMAPYAEATGYTADTPQTETEPLLPDGDWLRIQAICDI